MQITDVRTEEHRVEESVKKTEAAIEAVLFSMGDAVELKDLSDVLQVDTKTLQKILDDMMVRYEEEDRGIKIVKLENAYQLCTKNEFGYFRVVYKYDWNLFFIHA